MAKLNQKEQSLLNNIKNYLTQMFDRIALRKNAQGKVILDSSCYGEKLPDIKDSVEGQIYFLIINKEEQ